MGLKYNNIHSDAETETFSFDFVSESKETIANVETYGNVIHFKTIQEDNNDFTNIVNFLSYFDEMNGYAYQEDNDNRTNFNIEIDNKTQLLFIIKVIHTFAPVNEEITNWLNNHTWPNNIEIAPGEIDSHLGLETDAAKLYKSIIENFQSKDPVTETTKLLVSTTNIMDNLITNMMWLHRETADINKKIDGLVKEQHFSELFAQQKNPAAHHHRLFHHHVRHHSHAHHHTHSRNSREQNARRRHRKMETNHAAIKLGR